MSGAQEPISNARLDEIFDYWFKCDLNYSKTAKWAGHDRKSVWRWGQKHGWVARAKKIRDDVIKGLDRAITKDVLTNVKQASRMIKKELDVYFDENRVAEGKVKEILDLFKYVDEANGPNEIADAIKAASKQDDIPYNPDLADELIMILLKARQEEKAQKEATDAG